MMKSFIQFILNIITKIYPFLKSKTGYLNPRVKHTTELGFTLRSYMLLSPNPNKWMKNPGTILFPKAVQVQTVNRCNAACRMCPYPYTTAKEEYQEIDDALWQKIIQECAQE